MFFTLAGASAYTSASGFGTALAGGRLKLYSGPAFTAKTPGSSNTLLSTATIDTPAFNGSGMLQVPDDPVVSVAGSPSVAVLETSAGVPLAVLTVAGPGGIGDLIIDDGSANAVPALTPLTTWTVAFKMPLFDLPSMLVASAGSIAGLAAGQAGDATWVVRGGVAVLVDVCPPVDIPLSLSFPLSDMVTSGLTTGVKWVQRMPFPMVLTEVRTSLMTASSSGLVTVSFTNNGTAVLSTAVSIDATEKTSKTAATPAVIANPALADDDELSFSITAAGTGAKGLVVTLIGYRP